MKTKLKTGNRKTSVTRREVAKTIRSSFIIPVDIYNCDVMISVGELDEVLIKRLMKSGVSQDEVENARYTPNAQARYCLFKTGQSLIRIKNKPKAFVEYGYLQHEVFHCASAILWQAGIKLKIKTSDEAYAYLIGFLTTEIYKKLYLQIKIEK